MAKQQQPVCEGCPLTVEDLARVEEGLRQLVPPRQTIEWCKRCGIPCEAADRECADLERFFQAVLANSRGPQSTLTGGPT